MVSVNSVNPKSSKGVVASPFLISQAPWPLNLLINLFRKMRRCLKRSEKSVSLKLTHEDISALRLNQKTAIMLRLPFKHVSTANIEHATESIKGAIHGAMGFRPAVVIVPGKAEVHSYNIRSLKILRAEIDEAIRRKEGRVPNA